MKLTEASIREALPRIWSPGKSQPREDHWFRFNNAIFVRGSADHPESNILRQVGVPTPCLLDLLNQSPEHISNDFIVKLHHYRGEQYEQSLGRGDRILYTWDLMFNCWKLML
jgi:hypothetical protein